MGDTCEFCGKRPRRRFRPVAEKTMDIVDCANCGVFEIGGTSSAQLKALSTEASRAPELAMIREINRRGFIHVVSGTQSIKDEWDLLPQKP